MEKKRNPMLYISCGKKGGGKTYTTINKVLEQYIRGANPKRVLIVDVNGEYTQYKTIALKDIELFSVHPKKGVRRIVPPANMSLDDISKMLLYIVKTYRNGALVIEDINAYVSDSLPADLIGTIIRLRHFSIDVIIHYQNVGRLKHPKILGNVNVVRLHKTTDSVDRHKSGFEDSYEILKIAELIVENDFRKATTNPEKKDGLLGTFVDLGGGEMEYKSCYVYINFDKSRISGNFTKEHFIQAVDDYIMENETSTIRKYLAKKNKDGSLKYNYKQALYQCENDLYLQYYGNSDR